MNPTKTKAAIILGRGNQDRIYPSSVRQSIDSMCHVVVEECIPDEMARYTEALTEVKVLFSGWGAPVLNTDTLALMPRLEAVFYGAGTIKDIVTDAFWERNIPICSAWASNAVPVAEFAVAQIILSLKQAWLFPQLLKANRGRAWPEGFDQAGAFGTKVALISLGQIGQRVARMLQSYEVEVLAYDPFCSAEQAEALGVRLVDLETCFDEARVVSLHSPLKPETRKMFGANLFQRMPTGATLINTARGGLIDEIELAETLRKRPDLTALLDVTDPEPPQPDSALYDLENCFLTPHIAGSKGSECGRMGKSMVEECQRFLAGKPMKHQISKETFSRLA